MKTLFRISAIVILLTGLTIYFPSCKKEIENPVKTGSENKIPPTVMTFGVSSVTQTSVSVQGSVMNNGGTEAFTRGICWSTSENPTIADNSTSEGSGVGYFVVSIANLMPGTRYYVRAYAINGAGTSYGSQVSFTTTSGIEISGTPGQIIKASSLPILTTTEITSITASSAVSGGNITDDGGGDITHRGISLSTLPDAYIYSDDVIIVPGGSGSGSFVSYLSGLKAGTTYYVRAFAVNSEGIALGTEISFKTAVY
jgi:hypothetical protein